MFGALALMPIESLNECLGLIKAQAFSFENICPGKSVQEFVVYFEKTWINGIWSPKIWNYFDYIGRKTNNDLENFNKHANDIISQKHPSIFKFINFIQDRDALMTQAAQDYKENPTNPALFPKTSKQIKALQKDLDNKNAFINKEITLNDYFYAQAANIDYIEHIDPDDDVLLDDVLNPLNSLNFESESFDHPIHDNRHHEDYCFEPPRGPNVEESREEDEIQAASELENLLVGNNLASLTSFSNSSSLATNSTSSFVDSSVHNSSIWSCFVCGEETGDGSHIQCSKCFLFIHYKCNQVAITKYYKTNPKNFKCYLCKNKN